LNFIECETPRKLRGGYYTEPDIALFLARWVLEGRPRRVLEPACGDGAFLAALNGLRASGLKEVVGCERDLAEAAKARDHSHKLAGDHGVVHAVDFLQWALDRPGAAKFDAVLGNPPYVRYQYLDAAQQRRAERIFHRAGLCFTKHTNAWVPFVVAALGLLRPGGRLAMVLPAELLHVLHAGPLRQMLLRECGRILILDPEDLWFGDALQGIVLLLAEKRHAEGGTAELAIVPMHDRRQLADGTAPLLQQADFLAATELQGKWMGALLQSGERATLAALEKHPAIRRFGQVADVDVGIVTGANQFFLVSDAVASVHGLERWAHPMFGRSEHVPGVIYDRKTHEQNRGQGLRANFLWFNDGPLAAAARRYIASGEQQGLHRRFKCRVRRPWYRVPSVYAAPVGMLKRCHHLPRLVLNQIGAFTTDTAYRIQPRAVAGRDLVGSFVNSLTALSAELEGRHYGGGVLELVPSEIERLLLPLAKTSAAQLRALDAAVRQGVPAEALLTRQDEQVLRPLGISGADCVTLRAAWDRLRSRRQRGRKSLLLEPVQDDGREVRGADV
jgi:adenine-specific DNA methylase